jgi:hypothetical protein
MISLSSFLDSTELTFGLLYEGRRSNGRGYRVAKDLIGIQTAHGWSR